ncbi:MAG: hypothetical protein FJ118_17245 [Deltaproteobacteria bacterium]|nr:hypothetical protein [Deltaproteobacteria bacterium]
MNRLLLAAIAIITVGTMIGCAVFQKKDEPPPLPPIEETKPPLSLKGEHFKSYPWDQLPKPLKDGNDPDTFVYTAKASDTIDSIAEKNMGDATLAPGLASYNQLSPSTEIKAGEKIVIPYPIIGVSSQLALKRKGDKQFGDPVAFTAEMKKGDEYKLRFETNVNGHLYVFRHGPKETTMLYPALLPKSSRTKSKTKETLMRDPGIVRPHDAILIPTGPKGIQYDPMRAGDKVYVFFSLRPINGLEDLKEKKKITQQDLEDVLMLVKEGEIRSDPPLKLIRISDPKEVLGFTLNLGG